MRDSLDKYLENVLCHADLARGDERQVRAELAEHLQSLVEKSGQTNPKEIYTMLSEQFGSPRRIGRAIAAAKGRVRTYFKKQLRKLPLRVAILTLLVLGVRHSIAQVFYVPGRGVEPEIPRGAHVVVYKLAHEFQPGDIVVYRSAIGDFFIGTIDHPTPTGWLVAKYSGACRQVHDVRPDQIIGRVILTTR